MAYDYKKYMEVELRLSGGTANNSWEGCLGGNMSTAPIRGIQPIKPFDIPGVDFVYTFDTGTLVSSPDSQVDWTPSTGIVSVGSQTEIVTQGINRIGGSYYYLDVNIGRLPSEFTETKLISDRPVVFPGLDDPDQSGGYDEYVGFFLYNSSTGEQVNNVGIYIADDLVHTTETVRVGVDPTPPDSIPTMVTIADINTAPAGVVFSTPTVGSPLAVPNVPAGAGVGIWLNRHIDSGTTLTPIGENYFTVLLYYDFEQDPQITLGDLGFVGHSFTVESNVNAVSMPAGDLALVGETPDSEGSIEYVWVPAGDLDLTGQTPEGEGTAFSLIPSGTLGFAGNFPLVNPPIPTGINIVHSDTGVSSTKDITFTGFGTPSGAILYISGTTSDGSDSGGLSSTQVYWDGTNTYCFVTSTEASADANQENLFESGMKINAYDGTVDAEGTISSITDGIRLSWSDSPSQAWKVTAILFDSTLSTYEGWKTGGPSIFTWTPGFAVDAILTHSNLDFEDPPARQTTARWLLGGAVNDVSPFTQGTVRGWRSPFSEVSYSAWMDTLSIGYDVYDWRAGSGTDVLWDEEGTAAYRHFAYNIGPLTDTHLNEYTIPAVTGVDSVNVGFRPDFVMAFMIPSASGNVSVSITEDLVMCVGMADAYEQGCHGWYLEAANWPAEGPSGMRFTSSKFIETYQSTAETDERCACTISITANGYDLDWTQLGAEVQSNTKNLIFAFKV